MDDVLHDERFALECADQLESCSDRQVPEAIRDAWAQIHDYARVLRTLDR